MSRLNVEQNVLVTPYIAGMGANWWSMGGQLFTSVVIVLSVIQDIGLRAWVAAALGSTMAIVFGVSAMVDAIRMSVPGGVAICAAVYCFESWLIVRWILRLQNNGNSQ
jgi:hypothetical protein